MLHGGHRDGDRQRVVRRVPQVALRSWVEEGGDLAGGRAGDGARDGEARARGEAERWPRLGAGDEAGEGEDERASQSATALASTTAVIRLKCFISSAH